MKVAIRVILCVSTGVLAACTGGQSQPNMSSPGAVAVAWANDVFSQRISAAEPLVLPGSREEFNTLNALTQNHLTSAKDLQAGSVTITGETAVVILTGTICSGAKPGTKQLECMSNTDPHTTNAAFRVSLRKSGPDGWYVTFPEQQGSPNGASTPAPPPP